jgi:hypothetical protein
MKLYDATLPRQIGEPANIMAMDPCRALGAERAGSSILLRADDEDDAIGLGKKAVDRQAGRQQR